MYHQIVVGFLNKEPCSPFWAASAASATVFRTKITISGTTIADMTIAEQRKTIRTRMVLLRGFMLMY